MIVVGSCDSSKLNKTPINQFEGLWKLDGRSMFDGIQISITSKENSDKLIGRVTKLNENKYIKMFVDSGDTWISGFKRISNYQFELTEKKIGSQLFSLYGQSTSTNFKAQFIDINTIGLSSNNSDPEKSKIVYRRVKKK